jgi:hypothetical protein
LPKLVELEQQKEREAVRAYAKRLVNTLDGSGIKLSLAVMDGDGVEAIEVDKLIVGTLRDMIYDGIGSPLLKLALVFLWGDDEEDSPWQNHLVGHRVVSSAMLLEKYRRLQREKKDGGVGVMRRKLVAADSLFDVQAGLRSELPLGEKMMHYRKILVSRGIIPRRVQSTAQE